MADWKITKSVYDNEVLASKTPVLIDFFATWCGPCRMLAPILDELGKEYEGKIKIGRVDVDEEIALANLYQIESIPTLVLIKDGTPIDMTVGLRTKADIAEMIEKAL